MLRFITGLFVVTVHVVLLYGSKRCEKIEYKPYGPKMCKQLCRESNDSFIYIEEDVSCHRIPVLAEYSFRMKTNTSDGLTTYVVKNSMKTGNNSRTAITGIDMCGKNFTGDCSSDLMQNLSTYAFQTGYPDSDTLIPEIILHQACYRGNLCVVKYILYNGLADINSRDHRGRTPVMLGAEKGHLAVFDFLVSQGCNLSIADDHANTVLHGACIGGNIDIVKKLIDRGTYHMEGRGYHGMTPVMYATFFNHREVFDLLVRKGCDLTAVDDFKDNILHIACIGGHLDMVKYSMEMGVVDKDSRGRESRTAVLIVASIGPVEIVKYLVSKGCNWKAMDRDKNNILHVACLAGDVDIVKYILSLQLIDIDSRGREGRTPVQMAALNGHVDVVKYLVSKGCNIRVASDRMNNILHIACLSGRLDVVKYIVSLQAIGVERKGQYGNSPIQLAATKGHVGIVKFLIGKGYNLSAVDDDNNNILHIACFEGHIEMVEYILSLKVIDIESRGEYGWTPLLRAACDGEVVLVKYLVSKGCSLKAVDDKNDNILHIACLCGRLNTVKYILSQRVAGLESKGMDGQTPVMRAVEYGHLNVVKFLVAKGSNLRLVDDNMNNLLHLACKRGFVDMVRYIIKLGLVDKTDRNINGLTASEIAIFNNHKQLLLLLH